MKRKKNWWPLIYQILFGLSVGYALYCVLHRDSRLPIAALCVVATAYFYYRETKQHGK